MSDKASSSIPTKSASRPDARWSLSKSDIRAPVANNAWPVARLELMHPVRGKVTDIGAAPGALDAALAAAGNIVGISPKLLSYHVTSHAPAEVGALSATVELELEWNGKTYAGSSFGVDLIKCTMSAWLDAVGQLSGTDDPAPQQVARPFQVSGVDENGDLWIFASSDKDAARSMEDSFRCDEYTNVRPLSWAV